LVHSSAFRLLSVLITLSLIVALSALAVLTLRSQPTVTIQPIPTSTPTTPPTASATPFQTLGADLVVPQGGYRFQPLLGYEVTMQDATVALTRVFSPVQSEDAAVGESMSPASTIGLDTTTFSELGLRPNQPLAEVITQVAQPFISRANAEMGEIEPVTLGGRDGVALSLRGALNGEPVQGRVVVAPLDNARLFIAAATAPTELWAAETDAALASVLQSVTFFEPIVQNLAPTPSPTQRAELARTPIETPNPTEDAAFTPAADGLVTATLAETPAPLNATPTRAAEPGVGAVQSTPTQRATTLPTITTLLVPTPTPTATAPAATAPAVTAPAVTAPSRNATLAWTVVTDGNWMNALAVAGNTIWIASDGGALAWTRGSSTPVKFTSINGLTTNHLTAVATCDLPDLGVLFGSNDGLQVVDPRAGGWRQLNSSNSELSYDDVSALLCNAEAGYLVIGFARHGIDVFDAQQNIWRHLDRNSGLASNNVRGLAVVGDLDEIWVMADDGITLSAGADSTFYNANNSPLESNRLGSILADATGAIWLGGDGVLYRIDGEEWTVFSAEEVNGAGFPLRLITGLAPAPDGNLWLGDIDGAICRFDPDTATCIEAFSGEDGMATAPLTHLTVAEGQLYFTSAGDGFSINDGDAWQRLFKRNEGIRGNAVRAAATATDGALWVATDGGIQRITAPNRPPTVLPDSGIDPASIQALYVARNGDIWIGGDGAGVWNGERWTLYSAAGDLTAASLAGGAVRALAEDSRGRIWLGTDAGVSIWNGASFFNLTRETGLPSDDIRALLAEGDAMWIGSAGGGLYRFSNNQLELFTMENVGLPSDTITALAAGEDGTLYVGADIGLAELRNGAAAPLPAIGEHTVTQLLVLDGALWVGTERDGLFYDVGEGWQQETTAGALPANHITALAADDGAVWIGGETGGLVRYSLAIEE
jgi:ligand-binding sensor domain-containing protein